MMEKLIKYLVLSMVMFGCSSTPKTESESIIDAIGAQRGAVRSCYEDALASLPATAGRLVLDWTIEPNGRAKNVVVKSSTLNNPILEKCVIQVMLNAKYPAVPEPRTVTYPFEFRNRK